MTRRMRRDQLIYPSTVFNSSTIMTSTNSESNNKMDQGEGDHSDSSLSGEDSPQAAGLKKGPWTAAEDEILREHVKKHKTGNWNSVNRLSGLARSGKSCRLRWNNHLRPNLKKDKISREEEDKIILLHSQMGNKWAKIATQLEGRTDNEIKNFWYTRVKRCQRLKKPIYPPHICPQAIAIVPNEDNDGGIRHHPNEQTRKEGTSMDAGGVVIPRMVFDRLDTANVKPILPYLSDFLGPGFCSPFAPVQPPFGGTMGIQGFSNGGNVLSGQPPETMELPSIQYGGGNFLAWSTGPPLATGESIELPLEAVGNGTLIGNVMASPALGSTEMIQELPPRSMCNQVVPFGNFHGNVVAPPQLVMEEMIPELPAGPMSNQVVPAGNFMVSPPLVLAEMTPELPAGAMGDQVVLASNFYGDVMAPPPSVSAEMIQELLPRSMSNHVVPLSEFNGNFSAPLPLVSSETITELPPRKMISEVVPLSEFNGNFTAPLPLVSSEMITELPLRTMSSEVVPLSEFNGNFTAALPLVSSEMITEVPLRTMSSKVVNVSNFNGHFTAPPPLVSAKMITKLSLGAMGEHVIAEAFVPAGNNDLSGAMVEDLTLVTETTNPTAWVELTDEKDFSMEQSVFHLMASLDRSNHMPEMSILFSPLRVDNSLGGPSIDDTTGLAQNEVNMDGNCFSVNLMSMDFDELNEVLANWPSSSG